MTNSQSSPLKTAAIVIHDGYTDAEFVVAYHYLLAWDFVVTVFSINGGPVKGINGWTHKYATEMGAAPLDPKFQEFDLLVLIGGVKALEYLRQYKPLIHWIKKHHGSERAIASICHGAQLLIEADIVRGRNVTGYYSIRKDIENAGGSYFSAPVVVDHEARIISSPHYDFSGQWIRAAVDFLAE